MSVYLVSIAGDKAPVFLLMFNVLVLFSTVIIEIVVFGIAGKIHENSIQLVSAMKKKPLLGKNTLFRHEVKSCPFLKIQFGSRSFMERSTCLTVMDFTMGQTANLLVARNATMQGITSNKLYY
jgi:hypothetical protein